MRQYKKNETQRSGIQLKAQTHANLGACAHRYADKHIEKKTYTLLYGEPKHSTGKDVPQRGRTSSSSSKPRSKSSAPDTCDTLDIARSTSIPSPSKRGSLPSEELSNAAGRRSLPLRFLACRRSLSSMTCSARRRSCVCPQAGVGNTKESW